MTQMHLVLFVLTIALIASCDAFFARRINVSEERPDRREALAESDAIARAVVRQYAAENNIPCDDKDQLPIECWRQPIRIWALRANNTLVFCYDAMGIPFESKKFQRQMDRLQGMLQERFGTGAVSVSAGRCPSPPSSDQDGSP